MELIIYLLLVLPIIGSIHICLKNDNSVEIRSFYSVLMFFLSLMLWFVFKADYVGFQYLITLHLFSGVNFSVTLGLDGLSLFFIILTCLLTPICILLAKVSVSHMIKEYVLCFLIMEWLLLLVFLVLDLLAFYVMYEAVLIPMYLIIGIWGSRKEKISASYYFFFFTLVGSLLMLLGIIYLYVEFRTTNYLSLLNFKVDSSVQLILWLLFFSSLAVKIPKVPFHIWLPQAHVEAPLGGSVMLARVLLKLGGYGFIRFVITLFPDASVYFSPLVFMLSSLAVVYASITTLRQVDLKRVIAYSSVAHMGLVTLGIFTMTVQGLEGSIFLMIAHGLVSSALFILVTYLYSRHRTRVLKYYKGMTTTMPLFSLIFLLFTLANLAMPLTCNFIGEVYILTSVLNVSLFVGFLCCTGMVFSAAYSLFLYNRISFGSWSSHIFYSRDLNRLETYVLLPLIYLTFLLGIYPNFIFEVLHFSCLHLLWSVF